MLQEKELVNRVLEGREDAFREVVIRYERLVVHMVSKWVNNKEDIEDLCQDVFLKVFKKMPGFRGEAKLSTWIATIAYTTTINFLRKRKIPVDSMDDEQFFLDHKKNNPETPEEVTDKKELKKFIKEEINKLPVKYKTLLLLCHSYGFEYKDIAEITGMPEGTVKSYLFRARNMLKERCNFVLREKLWI